MRNERDTSTRGSHILVIGTYTGKLGHVDGHATGILTATFDGVSLSKLTVSAEAANPSWVTLTKDGRFLYAVIETTVFEGEPGGGVAAYARDPETGTLTLLNTAASCGVEPAHLEVDPSERFLLVANYRTGSVSVFVREADGSLGNLVEHLEHRGSSAHRIRQAGPHAHQILFDPVTGDVLVPDLGLDAVFVYILGDTGSLTERSEARIEVPPGAGPRHLAFHPDGQHLFLLNELDNTLVALRRNGDRFEKTAIGSTLPRGFRGHSQASAVRVSHSGRSVLVSNRGLDSIAVFTFDGSASSFALKLVEPSQGRQPRDFLQTLEGSHIVVANQDEDTVVVFAFDENAPSLTYVSQTEVPTPVCLRFLS